MHVFLNLRVHVTHAVSAHAAQARLILCLADVVLVLITNRNMDKRGVRERWRNGRDIKERGRKAVDLDSKIEVATRNVCVPAKKPPIFLPSFDGFGGICSVLPSRYQPPLLIGSRLRYKAICGR